MSTRPHIADFPAYCTFKAQEEDATDEATVRAFYLARSRGESLDAFLTPDVVWQVPGRSLISGTYRGVNDLLRYIALRRELSANTMTIEVHKILARGGVVMLRSTSRAVRDGAMFESCGGAVLRLADGRIAQCTLLPEDRQTFDVFWS